MKSLLAVLAIAVALACSAAPAFAMPAYDSGSDGVTRAPAVVPSALDAPSDDGVDVGVMVALSAGALLAGAGIGFTVGRLPRRIAAT